MTSFKSKLFNFMIINRHLFKGKIRKPVFDMNTSIEGFRDECEKGANRMVSIPDGVEIKAEKIEDIKSEWLTPEGAPEDKVIMYVHGGGYVSGSCNDHRSFVSKFADNCGITCLQYEYRLAPEHPFPAALDDSIIIYKHLLMKGYKPENILIAGESAGGGLALAILMALKEDGLNMPKAAVAISPWTDLTCSSESYKTKNRVSAAPQDSWFVFSKHYVAGNDPENPLISPLFGNPTGFPPIFINSAENDELFDDGKKFHEQALKCGVDSKFTAGKGMIHCYPLMAPMFKEATEAMNEIVDFVKLKLQK